MKLKLSAAKISLMTKVATQTLLVVAAVVGALAYDNGVGLKPPMGKQVLMKDFRGVTHTARLGTNSFPHQRQQ